MDYNNMLVLSATICFLFLFGRIFVKPIKFAFRIALNSILGCLLIVLINYIGLNFNFHIGINIWTSVLVGILGIPGAVLLVILQIFIF